MTKPSINKVTLTGNLGADPETRFTPSGVQVATVNLATDDEWTDKRGERHERTEWHRLVLWRRLAEIAGQYLKKGSRVHVEGRLQTRNWEDPNGRRHYVTEIMVTDLQVQDAAGSPAELDLRYGRQDRADDGGDAPTARESRNRVAVGSADLPF